VAGPDRPPVRWIQLHCWNCSIRRIAAVPTRSRARLGGGRPWASAVCHPARGLISPARSGPSGLWGERLACGEAPPGRGTGECCGWRQGEGVGVHAGSIDGGAGQGGQFRALPSPNYARPAAGREPAAPARPDGEGLRLRIILFPGGRRLPERTSNAAFAVWWHMRPGPDLAPQAIA